MVNVNDPVREDEVVDLLSNFSEATGGRWING